MIYITGDTHCPIDIGKLKTKKFPIQKEMTKNDYLIICGDFGGVWYSPKHHKYKEDIYWRKWLDNKPFTTLFVDGNHENYDVLNSYPIIDKFGGKVGKISDSIYHLKRGEIYKIEDKLFYCFGGASSHDKVYRTEGISWWPEEMPSISEMNYGVDNLKNVNFAVDYIISHCCSSIIQSKISDYYEKDGLTQYLKFIEEEVSFSHWFFGHYHIDKCIDNKHTCLYQDIIKVL